MASDPMNEQADPTRRLAELEAENALKVSQGNLNASGATGPADPTAATSQPTAEAQAIIASAHEEASQIREQAMHLLAIAEGEKAESHEIAQSETERATAEAERLRAEAEAEAERLRAEAEAAGEGSDDASIYSKRRGRKLPRIGDNASNLLSEMSGLRARSADVEDRQVS